MNTSPVKVAMVLNDFQAQNDDDVHFLSSYNGNQRQSRMKPIHSFRNWTRYFKIPYFCFVDIAVFSFYIIFAIFHESSSITFSVDLENAIHSFLTNDISLNNLELLNTKNVNNPIFINPINYNLKNKKYNPKHNKFKHNTVKNVNSRSTQIIHPPIGIPFGEGQIFLLNDFIYMLDETTAKLFQFSSRFPMSHQILDDGYVTMTIILLNGTVIEHTIKSSDENYRELKATVLSDKERVAENADSKETDFEFTEKSFLNNKIRFRSKIKKDRNKFHANNNDLNEDRNKFHANNNDLNEDKNKFHANNNDLNEDRNKSHANNKDLNEDKNKFNANNNDLNENNYKFAQQSHRFTKNSFKQFTTKSDSLNDENFELNKESDGFNYEFLNSRPSDYVIPYLRSFEKVSVSMSYHLQIVGRVYDSRINLDIISDFSRDLSTDTIVFDIYHTRFQEKSGSFLTVGTAFYTINFSLPLVIILLNIFAICRLLKESVYDLYSYSKRKSEDVGQMASFIFSKKFDKWNLYSIIAHFVSIVAMVVYIIIGQNIEQKVPPINVFLSIATFMQSILLIRYLNLKDTTFLIITVLFKSSVILVKFLLGCLPFFFAFWVFGICFFGHISFMFASPLECASYLFCVMHGDSILAFFDNTIIQNDYHWALGFFYSASWLMFSLLLVFNITISIFQDVLRQENALLAKKAENEQNVNNNNNNNNYNSPLHLDFMTNNIRLMMNSNQYKNPNAFQQEIAPP